MVAGAFVAYLVLATLWWNLGLPAGFSGKGLVLLDQRAGWGPTDVKTLFLSLGELGRGSYRLFLGIDTLMTVAAALALGPLIAWPLERIRPDKAWVRLPALLPWAVCALELLENVVIRALLDGWPYVDSTLAVVGGTLTLGRLALLGLLPVALVSSWLGYGVVKLLARSGG